MKKIIVVFLTLFSLGQVAAQEAIAGYGIGAGGCGEYLEHRKRDDRVAEGAYLNWVYGFFSARNYYEAGRGGRQILKETIPGATVLAYVDKVCRDHPLASVAWVAKQLADHYAGLAVRPNE